MTTIAADADLAPEREADPTLEGVELFLGVGVLGLVTFLVVLDITIVNVILSAVASSYGSAPHEVTMGITVFAAAQAVVMPLTGWLSQRFGIVRTFLFSLAGFGVTSLFCGMAPTLSAFLVARILQGLTAGPMLPLVQTLLQRCVPKAKLPAAFAFWTIMLSMGPLAGPALGGIMADTIGWPWAFYINVPVAVVCVAIAWKVFGARESLRTRGPVDVVGLVLLIVWVASLQFVLDKGRELEWFASPLVLTLAILALVGFTAFMLWEFTDRHPLIDFSVFRYRSFWVCTPISAVSFSAHVVVTLMMTLWLQLAMGYTATLAGIAIATMGFGAIVAGPIAAMFQKHFGGRALVFVAMSMNCANIFWRSTFYGDVTFGQVVATQFVSGFVSTAAMMPLFALAMGDIPKEKLAAGASMLTFIRVLTLGCLTAVMTTLWQNGQNRAHDLIAGVIEPASRGGDMVAGLMSQEQVLFFWNAVVDRESITLATTHALYGLVIFVAIGPALIWFSPKPREDA